MTMAAIAVATFAWAAVASGGDLDRRFGKRGLINQSFAPLADDASASSISLFGDDRFVVAGRVATGNATGFGVARYTPKGKLDRSFSDDGLLVVPAGGFVNDVAVAALDDGRTAFVGGESPPGPDAPAEAEIVRLLPDGSPDSSLDGDGSVTVPLPAGDFFGDAATGPDGSAVIASTDGDSLRVARVGADGQLDLAFGEGGTRIVPLPGSDVVFGGISLAPDGRILVSAGAGDQSSKTDLYVARLTVAGALDPSFSGDGIASADVGRNDFGGELVTGRRGRVLVTDSLNRRQGLVRFGADGELDSGFGEDGAFVHPNSYGFTSNLDEDPEGVFTQGRKILLFTETSINTNRDDFLLLRVRPNGTLDRRFSGNGKARVDFGGNDGPYAGAVQSTGRILLAGYHDAAKLTFAIAGIRK
jgi:uncharacterized delta-60 repeat protein